MRRTPSSSSDSTEGKVVTRARSVKDRVEAQIQQYREVCAWPYLWRRQRAVAMRRDDARSVCVLPRCAHQNPELVQLLEVKILRKASSTPEMIARNKVIPSRKVMRLVWLLRLLWLCRVCSLCIPPQRTCVIDAYALYTHSPTS